MNISRVSTVVGLAIIATLSFFPSVARATTMPRYWQDGWTLVPVAQNQTVIGVFAYMPEGELVGDNLGVIWFTRNGDNTWDGLAFPSNEVGAAINSIRDTAADETLFAGEQDLRCEAELSNELAGVVPIKKGLPENDPAQPALDVAQDPAAFVAALAQAGWQAARGISEMFNIDSPCSDMRGIDFLLESTALRAEADAFDQDLQPVICLDGTEKWPCAGCTVTYSGITATGAGTWTVTSTTLPDGSKKCFYSRPASATRTLGGLTMIFCNTCTGTSTVTGNEKGVALTTAGQSCPSAPSGNTWFVE